MSVTLSPPMYLQFFTAAGVPAFGYQLFTYIAGTSTKQATWTDSTQTSQNSNPIVLDSQGAAYVWLDPTLTYKFVLALPNDTDPPTGAVRSVDNIQSPITASFITAALIGSVLYPRTAAEIAAAVTPVNYFYAPGNLNRYGANTTPGTTDMSTALTNALVIGQDVYIPGGSYYFAQTSAFTINSNQSLYGDGPTSLMTFASNNTSNILGNAVTDAAVRNVRIAVTGAGIQSTLYIGVVEFSGVSTNCVVEGCDFSGYSMMGVLLQDAVSCTVRRNYFHSVTLNVAAGDGNAVMLRGTAAGGCLYNVVAENQVFASSYSGIKILTGSGVTAGMGLNLYNIVSTNRISTQAEYGILLSYSGNGAYDLFNSAIGNYIEDIQGTSDGGSSGAGIYAVAAGGLVIANNTIRNCCVQTSSESLAPAGIGISSTASGAAPCTVIGNHISGMTKYHGIDITSCSGPVNIVGNTVSHPSSNTTGAAIKSNQNSACSIRANSVYSVSTQNGIWIHLVASAVTQADVTGNTVSCAGQGIVFDVTSGSATQVTVSDNNVYCSGAYTSLILAGIIQGTVNGNSCSTVGAAAGMTLSACTYLRMSGNVIFSGSATFAFTTTGTCTGGFADETNYFYANSGTNTGQNAVTNGATGFFIAQLGTAAPSGGAHIIGDRVKYTNAAAAAAPGAYCTTGGTPGTWKTEAVLSA